MRLAQADIDSFYRLFHSLLVHVNEKAKVLQNLDSVDDLRVYPIEEIQQIRDKLYEQPDVIDTFVGENPFAFSSQELDIVSSWRHFVAGRFYVFRYLKKYTVLLDSESPKAFGVLALASTFEEMFGPQLPIMIEAVLLPFKGKIIYDSLFTSYSISFGRNMRGSFNESYNEAKARYGIISSLPFSEEKELSNAELLKFYLKNKQNRERYWEEIEELIQEPELLTLFHQETGKINARIYGRQLKEIGIKDAWFALLEGIIVGSGSTKKEVERTVKGIVPAEKLEIVHIFKLKGK